MHKLNHVMIIEKDGTITAVRGALRSHVDVKQVPDIRVMVGEQITEGVSGMNS